MGTLNSTHSFVVRSCYCCGIQSEVLFEVHKGWLGTPLVELQHSNRNHRLTETKLGPSLARSGRGCSGGCCSCCRGEGAARLDAERRVRDAETCTEQRALRPAARRRRRPPAARMCSSRAESSQLIERKPGQYRPQSACAIVIISFRARVTHTHTRARAGVYTCVWVSAAPSPSVSQSSNLRCRSDLHAASTSSAPGRCVAADAVAASLKEAASFAKCLDEVGARIRPSASSS